MLLEVIRLEEPAVKGQGLLELGLVFLDRVRLCQRVSSSQRLPRITARLSMRRTVCTDRPHFAATRLTAASSQSRATASEHRRVWVSFPDWPRKTRSYVGRVPQPSQPDTHVSRDNLHFLEQSGINYTLSPLAGRGEGRGA